MQYAVPKFDGCSGQVSSSPVTAVQQVSVLCFVKVGPGAVCSASVAHRTFSPMNSSHANMTTVTDGLLAEFDAHLSAALR